MGFQPFIVLIIHGKSMADQGLEQAPRVSQGGAFTRVVVFSPMLRRRVPIWPWFLALLAAIVVVIVLDFIREGEAEPLTSPRPAIAVADAVRAPPPPRVGAWHVAAVRWLDDRHVVLVLDSRPARLAHLETLEPRRRSWSQAWQESMTQTKPDWTARKALLDLHARHGVEARTRAGEQAIARPEAWQIQVGDGSVAPPTAVTCAYVSVDAEPSSPELGPVRYGVYAYLTLAAPCPSGASLSVCVPTIDLTHDLPFDETRTVSWAIKVNQVGYRPRDAKHAWLGSWLPGIGALPIRATRFAVVCEDTARTVFTGPVVLRDAASRCPVAKPDDPQPRPLITGEDVYRLDFSALTRPGRYRIHIAGVGVSWPFTIADGVYAGAFATAMRGLLHQRASFALKRPYTAWERPRFHTDPVFESQHLPFGTGPIPEPKGYDRFDVIGATIDGQRATADVIGGWYDAADYDRNISHYTVLLDLLGLFDRRPHLFTDGQLHLPESGNGIPDLLDEVEFGLRVWLQSQRADGGVSGWVETNTHPAIDDRQHRWAFSRRTRWSSLLFAGAAAKYARLVQPFAPEQAERYGEAAWRAYRFGNDATNALGAVRLAARRGRGTGEPYAVDWREPDDFHRPFLVFARTQLALQRQDLTLLRGIGSELELCSLPYAWPATMRDYSPWLYADLLVPALRSTVEPEIIDRVRSWLQAPVATIMADRDAQPYGHTWPTSRDFWLSWGESILANRNRVLLLGREYSEDQADIDAAVVANIGHDLGANPLGLSWTTGIGSVYPVVLQHEWSERDGIVDPMPGITVYGVTEGTYKALREEVWSAANGTVVFQSWNERPVWRRWSAHPHLNTPQCEFTIHETMAATIFSLGMLLADDPALNEMGAPREPLPAADLHGYWYLP